MKKKILTLLSFLTVACTATGCAFFGGLNSSESSSTPTESSTPAGSSTPDESTPDESSTPDDGGNGGEETVDCNGKLEYGYWVYWGNPIFVENHDGVDGMYFGAAMLCGGHNVKQYLTMPAVENTNTVSFQLRSTDPTVHPAGPFKIGYNDVVYTYDKEENAWKDDNGFVNSDIVMKDTKGNDVNFGALKYKAKWAWTVFTIKGVETDIEIIADFRNTTGSVSGLPIVALNIMNINWVNDDSYVKDDTVPWATTVWVMDAEGNKTEITELVDASIITGRGNIGDTINILENANTILQHPDLAEYELDTANSSLSATLTKLGAQLEIVYKLKSATVIAAGTFEYGAGLLNGNKHFYHDGAGLYEFAATRHGGISKTYCYVPILEGVNVLSIDLRAGWWDVPLVGTNGSLFQIGYNGKVYTYNMADNCWYDADGVKNENITMTDAEGNAVNLANLEVGEDDSYAFTTFTISGVETNVEFIYVFDNAPSNAVYMFFKNIVWTYAEVEEPAPEFIGLNKEEGGEIAEGDTEENGYLGTKVANPGMVSGAITIDGVMDDGYKTSATYLTLPCTNNSSNNTAVAWVTYDADNIYALVEVTDLTLDSSAQYVWLKDAVSFIVDFNYAREKGVEYTSEGIGYATIAIDGVTAFYHQYEGGVPYAVVVDEANSKYYVEIAMPFIVGFNGENVGFEIMVGDSVNGAQVAGYSWNLSGAAHMYHYTHVCGTMNFEGLEAKDEEAAPELIPLNAELKNISWASFEFKEGRYDMYTVATGVAYVEYVEGYNTLTFKAWGGWETLPFAGAFKLKVNGVVYTYNGEDNSWYNDETKATNIAMFDAEGNAIDISSLTEAPDGDPTKWPVVTFVITDVTENVEIISDNTVSPGHPAFGPILTLNFQEFVWTYAE